MPQGIGTYGSKVGRPPKYQRGGMAGRMAGMNQPGRMAGGMAGRMGGDRSMSPIAQSLVNPFKYGFKGGQPGGQPGGQLSGLGNLRDARRGQNPDPQFNRRGVGQYQDGGEVEAPTGHDNIDALIQANTLENIANFPRGESLDVLFKALTQGGDTRYIGQNIPGLPTRDRTESISNNLQRTLNQNPAYADTMSTEMAKQFMPEAFPGEERNEQGMMERLMGLFGK